MAKAAINISIGGPIGGGGFSTMLVGASAPNLAAVVTDTATLVSDGATPTQAHVNTLNTDVTAFNAAITGDVTVYFDTTKITTVNQLRSVLAAAMVAAQAGYSGLT